MKKAQILLLIGFMSLMLTFFATLAVADMLVVDIDPPDTNPTYWTGSDVNQIFTSANQGQLINANEVTEEAWLEALLGKNYNDPTVNYVSRILKGEGGIGLDDKQLTDYNPGVAWDYVVVKYDNNWIAYEDTGNDDLLTTDLFRFGVSHVTFFGAQPIPEPATMLLLGSGLIGLAGFARRRFKR